MNKAESSDESLVSLVDRAQALAEAGEINRAISAYRKWLIDSETPLAFAAQFNLAVLYFQIHQVGLAQSALRSCLACNPSFEPAMRLCTDTSLDSHRPMAARASFGHRHLRVGWLGSTSALKAHPLSAVPIAVGSATCEHIFFAWGIDMPPHAEDITGLSDDAAACLIRSREIDVLIDLLGWCEVARPGILAYHPASLQVAWTSLPKPSGLLAMDALIADEDGIPGLLELTVKEVIFRLEPARLATDESTSSFLSRLEALLILEHSKLSKRDQWPEANPESLTYILPPASHGRRYIIVAPPYQHTSAGIRVLYDLQKWLILAGYDAIVCTWFTGYPIQGFVDDIVIYPEVAPGNLLQAHRVVRYIMNVPGKLGHGEKTYAPNELLVAYNQPLAPFADGLVLQVPSTEPFFYNSGETRNKDAMYVGKGFNLGIHPPHCVEITKEFPPTRLELADFLRTVDTLYTYDDFTILAYEAKLCGCKLAVIKAKDDIEFICDIPMPNVDQFRAQLHRFIEITQRL